MASQGHENQEQDLSVVIPLHLAAIGGFEEAVALLLSDGAEANTKDGKGMTALMHASFRGHLGVVQMLLQVVGEQGLTDRDQDGSTALHFAADGGHDEMVAFLLSHGAQANSKDGKGMTPLMHTSFGGHLGVAQQLSRVVGEQGLADRDQKGWTALHFAADAGHEEVVDFLLSKGAEANSKDNRGQTPLMHAASEGRLGVVKRLFKVVGDGGLTDTDEEGQTALHYATGGGHEEVFMFLWHHGAEANAKDDRGQTPLMCASWEGSLKVVQALIPVVGEQGVTERDEDGWTALQCAAAQGHEEIVTFLLCHGAHANTKNLQGDTPLLEAVVNHHLGVVRMLLRHTKGEGLQEKNGRGGEGYTALHLACRHGCAKDMVMALLLAGADITAMDSEGATPRLTARLEGHTELVDLLEWWKTELDRPYLLHRAKCISDVYIKHPEAFAVLNAVPLPAFLKVRALPRVEVVVLQQEHEGEQGGSNTKASAEARGTQEGEEERHAVLTYVMKEMNEQLYTELLEGFHAPIDGEIDDLEWEVEEYDNEVDGIV